MHQNREVKDLRLGCLERPGPEKKQLATYGEVLREKNIYETACKGLKGAYLLRCAERRNTEELGTSGSVA